MGAPVQKVPPTPYQPYSSTDDVVYVIVKRVVNGETVRYIERMHAGYAK